MRFLLAAALLVPLAAFGEMYKCVDERGVTSYSDKPRPGCKQVDIQGSPPIGGRLQDGKRDGAQEEADFKRRQIELERASSAEKSALARRCAALRRDLSRLAPGSRVADLNEKGERVYMDDDTRDRKLAQLNADLRGCP